MSKVSRFTNIPEVVREFGVMDSQRTGVKYEKFRRHLLDREMLELLRNA